MKVPASTKVLIIGGGPAGSTVASFLADQGIEVTLFEKEHFPRYHIGESLIVSVQPIIDLLGARDEIDRHGFQKKSGVYWQWGNEEWLFDWKNLDYDYSYHVKREDFDNILLKNSQKKGAKVFQGMMVDEITFEGNRPVSASWTSSDDRVSGKIDFDYLVDASGRARIMANKYLKSIKYLDSFQNVAIWGYWEDVKIMTNEVNGPLTVGSIDDGWIWGIPLKDGSMSVGLVLHKDQFSSLKKKSTVEEIYINKLKQSDLFTAMTEKSKLVSDIKIEADYSYVSKSLTGPGYFLVGDSACFIDPLLSSGVHLAMHSALLASASLSSIINQEIDQVDASEFYQRSYQGHFLRWALLVSGFYQVNKSKDNHFWAAQQLSPREVGSLDIGSLDMKQIFATLVSGVVDLEEINSSMLLKETSNRLEGYFQHDQKQNLEASLKNGNEEIFDYLDRVKNRDPRAAKQRYNKGGNESFTFGLDVDNAVNDLYVSTSPFVHLAKLETVTI